MLNTGIKAPEFTLKNHEGNDISLKDFIGKKVVLYFYPKDNTPGCTKEACSFRDIYQEILDAGAVVVGISTDSVDSHEKFKDKHGLPFHLLSDPEHNVIELYKAWAEKTFKGKIGMGTSRITYIIDEEGTIVKTFPEVKPEEHGNEVLEALKG